MMVHDIIVIGAGMVGTSIAWHLRDRGANVLLVDRNDPGQETSYGNAGLIQREAVFPHPFPRAFSETLSVLPNQRPDIRYQLSGVLRYAPKLMAYRYFSAPKRWQALAEQWAQLISTCLDEHQRMIQAAQADDLIRRRGWLQLHRSAEALRVELTQAQRAADQYGVEFDTLSPEQLKAIEPHVNTRVFSGAIHWKNSWQVTDPGGLVKRYADDFVAQGGTFKRKRVTRIHQNAVGRWRVICGSEHLTAQHVVIAAGPWSMQLLKPLNYNFPLFPKRGYHWHYRPIVEQSLQHSILDADNGYLLGPMDMGIRLTTGAEMASLYGPPRRAQIQLCERIARDILPLGKAIEPQPWYGSRPCFPDMKPIIGPAPKHRHLWLAIGHAHQGFTLGPTTGRLLSELIYEQSPFVDPQPFSAERFKSLGPFTC
ncbi:MAG TPA: FAD-dependent oxidoreductase [Paenalcaligenes sp.]|nr:FAD-dependent oxidoreductase [Paenalcaligenes sp.]